MNEMISEKTENEDTEPTTQHREHRLPFHNGALHKLPDQGYARKMLLYDAFCDIFYLTLFS